MNLEPDQMNYMNLRVYYENLRNAETLLVLKHMIKIISNDHTATHIYITQCTYHQQIT